MSNYWQERSEGLYTFRGESFYTITPIPLYYRRRAWLLKHFVDVLAECDLGKAHVLDYGCGDGWYLNQFSTEFDLRFWGCDISSGFIERARQTCSEQVRLEKMPDKMIPFEKSFDVIYTVAVLAHISDEDIDRSLADIYTNLNVGGYFLFFEATASQTRRGTNWIRRSETDYQMLVERQGFKVIRTAHRVFPLFHLYEHTLLKALQLLLFSGSSDERKLKTNQSLWLTKINEFVLNVDDSLPWLYHRWTGNTFFMCQKPT